MKVIKKVRFNGVLKSAAGSLQTVVRTFQVRVNLTESELKRLISLVETIGAEEILEVRVITVEVPFSKAK
ncbi:hypothetical protein WOSG25_090100 [Weissella oryzae SG25]|uniref:Uncharacterized protein n=1 Tax=Weissella oryzae (strain DSM 25784 / JCM 18191 / LMG 30913 / SG25) TaxID=1329250 RepID=A0A069CVT9_WEIOS|nr:hypothetical protein [Weissella oryzae]GAK31313.1 hypothetical protein WOSG25_090100 [Weissella oryzae SG25]